MCFKRLTYTCVGCLYTKPAGVWAQWLKTYIRVSTIYVYQCCLIYFSALCVSLGMDLLRYKSLCGSAYYKMFILQFNLCRKLIFTKMLGDGFTLWKSLERMKQLQKLVFLARKNVVFCVLFMPNQRSCTNDRKQLWLMLCESPFQTDKDRPA